MRAEVLRITPLETSPLHDAFTDLCRWHGRYFCAFREAQTHNITPRGCVKLVTSINGVDWDASTVMTHPLGDMRDPKFLRTQDTLYLLCGVYLPHPQHHERFQGLANYGGDNLLCTHVTYTHDGQSWAPMTPIMRPNYWAWSALELQNYGYVAASYHTGTSAHGQTIALWSGRSPLSMILRETIYNGESVAHDGKQLRYAHYLPCEPVLYAIDEATVACCLRTETTMEIGVAHKMLPWRWHTTPYTIHPGAVMRTPKGWILAGRSVADVKDGEKLTTSALFALHGHVVEPLLTLPSSGDTGYCGLAHGRQPNTALVSYYSQHANDGRQPYGVPFPGADVYIAEVYYERG